MERPVRALVCALAAVVTAAPLAAAVYTIRLHNGHSFETRYEPEDASYDRDKVVFLDETGLLITIPKSEIDSIQSDFEAKGYGRMIDTTTMELGWAPNDAAEEGAAPADPLAQVQQAIEGQQQTTTYNQFVEPDATQGMPGNWVGGSYSSPPPPVVVPVPIPAPAAPVGGGDSIPPDVGGQ